MSEGPLFGGDDSVDEAEETRSGRRARVGRDEGARSGLHRLTATARALNSERDIQKLLDAVLDEVVDLTHAERSFVVLRRGERKIAVAASRSLDREVVQRAAAKISRSIVAQTEKSGRAVLTTNATSDPRFAHSDSVAYMKLRAVLCLPLAARGKSLGVLYLDNRFEEGVFRDVDMDLLEAFAAQAAIAIDNAAYRQEAAAHAEALEKENAERRRAEKRLATQNAVARLLGEATDPREAVPALLRSIGEGIGWDAGGVWEPDDGAGVLRCTHAWHSGDPALESFARDARSREFPRGEGMPGRVWARREAEWCVDIVGDPLHPPAAAAAAGLHAAVAFPVVVGGEVRAVMAFLSRKPSPEDPDLLAMLAALGAQFGQFIERRRAEEARAQLETILRQSQKMEAIGRLAGGVAHDFNNLLTVIQGFGQIAMNELAPDDPAREHIAQVEQAARRATALTRQLLAFSRRQVLAVAVLDLNHVVAGMQSMLRRIVGEDVELEFAPEAGAASVRGDAGQFEQVLMNLVVNARDAMPDGGRILVQTSRKDLDEAFLGSRAPECRPGPFVALTVSDTGAGIPPDVLAHIFEPFFTTKESGKGTGLGLATVYGIVRQSGGLVTVYSEPGHGATFKVFLPLVEEAAREGAATNAPPAPARGTETVLLTEDDPQILALTKMMLEARGYRVLPAKDGEEALAAAAGEDAEIHLLLTDVVMPRMNGIELAKRLRTTRPGLRVLFASGYTGRSLEGRGVLEDPESFLEKPFTEDALARKVRTVLDRPAEGPPPA